MEGLINYFSNLFDTSLWPARWHCGTWSDPHGWFYIISDLLIWSAYFAIPIIIVTYISRNAAVRFHKAYFLFAAFILACGVTHLLDAITFWIPMYRLNALILFITGVLSWITVIYLVKVLPFAFSLKTSAQLESEIDQRKIVEQELILKNIQLNESQQIAKLGHWKWEVKTNKLSWSDELFRIYELPLNTDCVSFDQFMALIHPDDLEYVDGIIKQAYSDKVFPEYFHRIVTPSGTVKTLHARGQIILDANGEIEKMIGTGQDITKDKIVEQELRIKSAELEATNAELKKFAYVASHDLQEPLRKINTFISRLQTEYQEQLNDERSQMYFGKIVNASTRMRTLIEDILHFSRLSETSYFFEPVDLQMVLDQLLADMEIVIEENSVIISADKLPEIEANATQMHQLFQNLISNSIKFKKTGVKPEIQIKCIIINSNLLPVGNGIKAHYKFSGWDDRHHWAREKFMQLQIIDNGIGFDQSQANRIFEVFQRLNHSKDYGGTGIGLAIAKKIVENHHGSISATSESGIGTSFIICLPLSQVNFNTDIKNSSLN